MFGKIYVPASIRVDYIIKYLRGTLYEVYLYTLSLSLKLNL